MANLQELAERLLSRQYLYPGRPATARLLPDELPTDLPFAVPLPDQAQVIGSGIGSVDGRTVRADIIFDVLDSSEAIFDFYRHEMEGRGWLVAPQFGPRGGFMPQQFPTSQTYCQGAQGPWFSVSVTTPAGAPADVRLHLETLDPGPCAQRPPARYPAPDMLPALYPPGGVVLRSTGGGGGPDRWSSDAVADTALAPAVLEAHFAGQMAGAGWTRIEGAGGAAAAWSAWSTDQPSPKIGLLLVLTRPVPGSLGLSVRVEAATGPETSGWTTTSMTSSR
jgi:hypothetical protein